MLTCFPQDYINRSSHCLFPFLLFLILLDSNCAFKIFMTLAFFSFLYVTVESCCSASLSYIYLVTFYYLLFVSFQYPWSPPLFWSFFHISYSEENVGSCVVNVINVRSQFGLTRPNKSTWRLKVPNLAVFVDQINWIIVKSLSH